MNLRLGIVLAAIVASGSGCENGRDGYPQLLPMDQLLKPPKIAAHAADAAQSPDAVGAELRARHHRSGGAATSGVAGDLDARAKALRDRARTLKERHPGTEDAACVTSDGSACPPQVPKTPE